MKRVTNTGITATMYNLSVLLSDFDLNTTVEWFKRIAT